MIPRFALFPGAVSSALVAAGILLSQVTPARAADDKAVRQTAAPKAPAGPKPGVIKAPRVPTAKPPAATPGAIRGGGAPQPDNHPGEQVLERLMKLNPEQRERAMQLLPEQRKINIQRRIAEIQKLPSAALNLNLARLERLNRLPQPRQGQVRRSINQFSALPEDRRAQIGKELQRISALQDEDRRSYMNTEEFRNRYSANEQQIISNIAEVTPEVQP